MVIIQFLFTEINDDWSNINCTLALACLNQQKSMVDKPHRYLVSVPNSLSSGLKPMESFLFVLSIKYLDI